MRTKSKELALLVGAGLFTGFTAFAEPTVRVDDVKVSIPWTTVPISLLRASAGEFIVGNLAPAEASALKVENGEVKLTVEVDESADLQTWEKAKTVEIAVPVKGEKGFYILRTK